MTAREACAESPYKAAVAYTTDGRLVYFSTTAHRAFLQTSPAGSKEVFQEAKVATLETFLAMYDWKPWIEREGFDVWMARHAN